MGGIPMSTQARKFTLAKRPCSDRLANGQQSVNWCSKSYVRKRHSGSTENGWTRIRSPFASARDRRGQCSIDKANDQVVPTTPPTISLYDANSAEPSARPSTAFSSIPMVDRESEVTRGSEIVRDTEVMRIDETMNGLIAMTPSKRPTWADANDEDFLFKKEWEATRAF